MPDIQPFKDIIIGDCVATKYGNQVLVRRRDGSCKTMELKEFVKFLKENLPQKTFKQDSFSKSRIFSSPDQETIHSGDNFMTRLDKGMHNAMALSPIKEGDSQVTKTIKSINNSVKMANPLNPMATKAFFADRGKYTQC